jgi:hypothetical protein
MQPSLFELIDRLESDPWRKTKNFSRDLLEVQDVLFNDAKNGIAAF